MTHRLIVPCVAVVLCAFGQSGLAAAQKKEQKKDEAEGRKGKTIGTLTSKGPNFIEVKADGEEKGRRYVPQWVGGNPDKGGGPDKAIVKLFSELKVGSRVEVEWVFEERLRALKVKVLHAPAGSDKKGDSKEEAKTGRTTGVLVAKGDKFIEVRGDGEEKARKYYAHYLKGPPPGFDPKILAQFDKLHLESRLLLEWIPTNHGPQVVRLEVLKDAKGAKDQKTSKIVGILTGKGKNFIELKADGDEEARKYFLHFGGTPKLLKAIHDTPIGSRVQVDWLFFEHRRVIDMTIVRPVEKE